MNLLQILNAKELRALSFLFLGSTLTLGLEILAIIIFLILTSFLVSSTGGNELTGFRETALNILTFNTSSRELKVGLLVAEITMIYVFKNIVGYSNILILNKLISKIQNRISEIVYAKFFQLPFRKMESIETNKASAALIDSINPAIAGQISFVLLGLTELLNISTIFIVLATQNTKVTLIFIVFCLSLVFFTYKYLRNKAVANGANLYNSTLASRTYFSQGKESISIFALSGHLPFLLENLNRERRKYSHAYLNSISLQQLPKYLIESYLIFALFFLYVVTQLFSSSESTMQFILIFLLAGFRILPSITKLQSLWLTVSDSKHRIDSFFKLYSLVNEESLDTQSSNPYRVEMPPHLRVERIVGSEINFSYNGRIILQNLDFDTNFGSMVLVKGPSGSGKTTLLKIISGLISPDSGSVNIHLSDGSIYEAANFPYMVGYAPQTPMIFKGSVARNILLSDLLNEIELEKIKTSLALVDTSGKWPTSSLHEELIDLGGTNLSGGEKQRLNIARAVAMGSNLIIMDEPTNSLDSTTADEIISKLASFSKNHNRIIFLTTHQHELHTHFQSIIEL